MSLLAEGTRVTSRLVVDRPLGEGAFAEVYRVRHDFLGWQAMKLFKSVVRVDGTDDALGVTRALMHEARLLSEMGHENIVRIFDADTTVTPEGVTRGLFTMEYVAGGNLHRLMNSYPGTVPVDVVVDVLEQIASGLAVAHDREPPVVHRDLTLANVLVGYDHRGLRIRLSDFGLAKRADPFTRLASTRGTYAYLAPEALEQHGYSRAADVWSVGTIAYKLLTGVFPFEDHDPFSSQSIARFREPLLPPSRFHDGVDADLDRIVMSMLEVDVGDRLGDARGLSAALRARRDRIGGAATTSGTGPVGPPSDRARELVAQALELAQIPGRLHEAADLLEEAITLAPQLRDLHLDRLKIWRQATMPGVVPAPRRSAAPTPVPTTPATTTPTGPAAPSSAPAAPAPPPLTPPPPSGDATEQVRRAAAIARIPGCLGVAADLLEQALALDPSLRPRYANRLARWRRGVIV